MHQNVSWDILLTNLWYLEPLLQRWNSFGTGNLPKRGLLHLCKDSCENETIAVGTCSWAKQTHTQPSWYGKLPNTHPKNQKNIDKCSQCYFLQFQSPLVLIEHLHDGNIIKPGSVKIPHVTTAELKGTIFKGIPLPDVWGKEFSETGKHCTSHQITSLEPENLSWVIFFCFPFYKGYQNRIPTILISQQWKGNCLQHDPSKSFNPLSQLVGTSHCAGGYQVPLIQRCYRYHSATLAQDSHRFRRFIARATLSGEVCWHVSLCPDLMVMAALAPIGPMHPHLWVDSKKSHLKHPENNGN